MRIYVHGCAYTENLPTLILLYKFIQKETKRAKSHSQSDGKLNVVSLDECHATYFALHLRRKKKIKLFILKFHFSFVLSYRGRGRRLARVQCTLYENVNTQNFSLDF